MKTFHVQVEAGEGGWLVGQAVEAPGAITQGRDLHELAIMARDAIRELTGEQHFQIDLILPDDLSLAESA